MSSFLHRKVTEVLSLRSVPTTEGGISLALGVPERQRYEIVQVLDQLVGDGLVKRSSGKVIPKGPAFTYYQINKEGTK